eukprot:7252643-Alexandrium_andersonii.AAC.1
MIAVEGGMAPDAASWATALEIEASTSTQRSYCAYAADIYKCFDQLSRAHIFCLAARAGCPMG